MTSRSPTEREERMLEPTLLAEDQTTKQESLESSQQSSESRQTAYLF